MQTDGHGGLRGKARRARHRNRAARMHAEHLIQEYLEPDAPGAHDTRSIPIRGRKEFMPSMIPDSGKQPSVAKSDRVVQLDLPLESKPKSSDGAQSQEGIRLVTPAASSTAEVVIKPAMAKSKGADDTTSAEESGDRAIRFSRTPVPTRDMFSLHGLGERRRRRFTLSGFLIGCAMGSAAAVALLFVLRTTVG